MITAYIGLGSNLNNPKAQLEQAINHLQQLPKTNFISVSSFYHSKPVGPQDQPDFINAVAKIETTLEPLELLDQLQSIEKKQDRIKTRHWGERTIDCDILYYGDIVLKTARLTIPHPEIQAREFVLKPLAELGIIT